MGFLFIIAFILVISTIVQAAESKRLTPCDRHKWVIDEISMKCSVCQKRAGK